MRQGAVDKALTVKGEKMRNILIMLILIVFLAGCASHRENANNEQEYVEITVKDNFYHFNGDVVSKGNEDKLVSLLSKNSIKKILTHDFTMGDLLEISSALNGRGYSFFFLNEKGEIKQINFL
ncbi:hypothetical protein KJI95_16245 [Shewanella sp. JM162201]|uniref:Lipoprotein n=1 Tax=Shewanella jiangmenensis TaxID=2837387 RepID=A0ABS5V6H3_9GAMM|nr:hypothetical protein [Shewanella jiangmenensis]MBT1446047.1 hypothetical protein [Shewanella jiangmenensis]